MGTSKNNPTVRQPQVKKYYQGKELKPAMYVGTSVGQGKYLSGAVDGVLVCDHNGKPLPYRSIPIDRPKNDIEIEHQAEPLPEGSASSATS